MVAASVLPPHLTFIERGVLHSNSIVVHAADRFLLIDTGYHTGVAALEQALAEQAGRSIGELAIIANTHVHPDHTGGNATFHARTGCEIVTSETDQQIVASGDPVTLMRDWADLACPAYPVTRGLRHGETFAFGPAEFTVIDGAGHAAGEISYYSAADKILICGDLLWHAGFSNVVPVVEGVAGLIRHERSLAQLSGLDIELAIPGHGPMIIGAGAVRARITETIDTIRFYRTHRDRWASTNIKAFMIMHVLVEGSVGRDAFLARCARAPWYREQAARFFPDATNLLDGYLDDLVGKRILRMDRDQVTCTLRA